MLAMILAGGRGTRLHDLTKKVAKPAVSYGGKYRIIDFPLSNCANSGIDIVGVLTQYESVLLNSYAAAGRRWGLDAKDSGVYVLPPREKADANLDVYRGTADAISQNIDFIDTYSPDYLLILSGDHIYKMNYDKMLEYHKQNNADATIAVIEVPMKEASRFGIMNTDETGHIVEFEEKPEHPKSNLASMGIYIFNWKLLRKMLLADMKNADSSHDFGKDIIPTMLNDGKSLYAYKFKGYWKDVGTIDSLWEANMDLLDKNNKLDLNDPNWKIYTEDATALPQYIGADATGLPFNSIIAILLENDHPSTPLVNAGAISACSMVKPIGDSAKKWDAIVGNVTDLCGSAPQLIDELYKSESDTNFNNRSIAWLLKNYNRIYDDPDMSLDLYTRQCSLGVTALQLSVAAGTIANGGVNPVTKKEVFDASLAPKITAMIAAVGFYEHTGDWMYTSGIPAKTGVGGGVMGVLPGQFGIAAFAPPLDGSGNSVKAQLAIEYIMNKLRLNVFGNNRITIVD